MGEEYGETAPFQFFTDHIDEKIAVATARRAAAASSRPSPRSRPRTCPTRRTRRRSCARSSRATGDEAIRALYVRLLDVRRELPAGRDADAVDCDPAVPLAARRAAGRSRSPANFAETRRIRARRGRRRARPRHPRRHAPGERPRRPARARRRAGPMTAPPDAGARARSGPAARSRSARPGTATARTSRCSPRTPPRVELCLFDGDGGEERIAVVEQSRPTSGTATCPASARGPALRLPRRTAPYDPADGPPLQPEQAPDRPVRQGDRGRRSAGTRRTTLPYIARRHGARRPRARRRGRRRGDPEVDRRRRGLRLGGRHAAADAVERDGHLRDPRQGLHDAPPGRARGPARHLRRARVRGGARPTSSASA